MPIHVVGLGIDPDALPEPHAAIIDQAHVLIGGKRQLEFFEDHPADKLVIDRHLEDLFAEIGKREDENTDVVVVADGDPLFYGIGKRLIEEFGEGVRIYPNTTVVQAAASTIKIPWDNVVTVSLHGRTDFQPLYGALVDHDWVAVLTDRKSIPSAIADALMGKGAEDFLRMWVFEDLATDDERYERYTLPEAADKSFSHLNLVLLEKRGKPELPLTLGRPCDEYTHDYGIITKWPVRAAAVAALRPAQTDVVWDLGAGCGSVSIEISAVARRSLVIAVEKNADRVAHIRDNIRRFGALAVDVQFGAMPDCLNELPDPDRVFIGGGLSKNNDVLREACRRLAPGGRIVVACVLMKTLMRTKEYLRTLDWPFEITLVQAAQSEELGTDMYLTGNNPVFIISADKRV